MICPYCGYDSLTLDNDTVWLAPGGDIYRVHQWCRPAISDRPRAQPSGQLAAQALLTRDARLWQEGRRRLAAIRDRERIATDQITGGYADLLEVGDAY